MTVVLPDLFLCTRHAQDVRGHTTLIGWCDDEQCRIYGAVGEASPCGAEYSKLAVRRS